MRVSFSQSEEVSANKLFFSENDIISLLVQVPFHSIINFIVAGGKCFEGNHRLFSHLNSPH